MGDLYKNVWLICEQNGTTVTQMCKDLEITRSILSELKSGRTKTLSLDLAQKIASFFYIDVDFLGSDFASDTCPECGFSFLQSHREDIIEHERIHEKRKKAIKKFGFFWNHVYRERAKGLARGKLDRNDISIDERVSFFEIELKAFFSRSLQWYDYDLDHISFNEYCAAMLGQKEYTSKIDKETLHILIEKYGQNNLIPTGTRYNPSREELQNRLKNVLSYNLTELRKDHLVSKAFISNVIGIELSEYSAIESGYKEPDNIALVKISNYYCVSTDYLLGIEENKKPADGELDEDMAVISKLVERLTPEQLDPVLDVVKNISSLNPDQIRSIAEVIKNMAK